MKPFVFAKRSPSANGHTKCKISVCTSNFHKTKAFAFSLSFALAIRLYVSTFYTIKFMSNENTRIFDLIPQCLVSHISQPISLKAQCFSKDTISFNVRRSGGVVALWRCTKRPFEISFFLEIGCTENLDCCRPLTGLYRTTKGNDKYIGR